MDKELTRSDQSLDQESGETIFQKGKAGRVAGAQIEVTDSSLEKDVAEFEPRLALNGGLDGLSEIRKVIFKISNRIITSCGDNCIKFIFFNFSRNETCILFNIIFNY